MAQQNPAQDAGADLVQRATVLVNHELLGRFKTRGQATRQRVMRNLATRKCRQRGADRQAAEAGQAQEPRQADLAFYVRVAENTELEDNLRGAAMVRAVYMLRDMEGMQGDLVAELSPFCQKDARQGTFLFTWQGPWGIMNSDDAPLIPERDPDKVAQHVSTSAWGAGLVQQVRGFVDDRVGQLVAREWGWSLEVCTRTLKDTGEIRVHLHMWINFGACNLSARARVVPRDFRFMGAAPHRSPWHGRCHGGSNVYGGLFYVQAAKIGVVAQDGNREMHVDYAVLPQWVFSLYVARKMLAPVARELLIRGGLSARAYVGELDFVEENKRAAEHRAEQVALLDQLRGQERPYRVVPEVTQWLSEFEELRDRYRFLVLDGPSRTGKSRFATGLVGIGRALVVDCHNAPEPNLRSFRRGEHDLVLFDECPASLVASCRKVFQSSIQPAGLGASATNQYAYSAWLHRVKLVVASNSFAEGMSTLSRSDQDWLRHNMVYVRVDSPLFTDP